MGEIRSATIAVCLILAAAELSLAVTDSDKYDEYTDISCEDELARLDGFAIALISKPDMKGYVMVYPGRSSKPGDARERVLYVRTYLIERGINAQRLRTVNGGIRGALTVELWLIPPGRGHPQASPWLRQEQLGFVNGKKKTFNYRKYRRRRCGQQ